MQLPHSPSQLFCTPTPASDLRAHTHPVPNPLPPTGLLLLVGSQPEGCGDAKAADAHTLQTLHLKAGSGHKLAHLLQ